MIEIQARQRLGSLELTIDLQTASSGVLALFGPSGAGKTSILNWLAGLSRPDSGRIRVGDLVLFDSAAGINLPPEQRRLGYVFQEPRLFPHLGVRDNLLYGWSRRRLQPTLRPEITLDQVVHLLGIEHLLARRIHGLSGGEQQRVAIGRALLAQPHLLLMDEPLAAVDVHRKSEILPFIERLPAELALPIVYVSHDPDEIMRIADHVALIADGKLMALGSLEDVLGRLDLPDLTEMAEPGAVIATTMLQPDDGSGLSVLGVNGPSGMHEIRIGRLNVAIGQIVHLRILARDVALARHPVDGISILNQLPGVVRKIASGSGPFIDLQIDIGALIWARISRKSADHLGFAIGDTVTTLIKSAAADPKKFG
jgi:molybdate transport system ATP-binding protein